MTDEIKSAMTILANKITASSSPDEALKFTQAMLNLAHAAATIDNLKK